MFERMDSFKYLRILIDRGNDRYQTIKRRNGNVNQPYYTMVDYLNENYVLQN